MGLTENQTLYLMQKEIEKLKRKIELLSQRIKLMGDCKP
jgi:hypothetical protein